MRVGSRIVSRRRYVLYFDGLGLLTFTASPDHASVTSYAIRVYAFGTSSPVLVERNIGVPTPDHNNDIKHDCTTMFTGLAAGNYTVTVNTTTPTGSAESAGVNFQLPLA